MNSIEFAASRPAAREISSTDRFSRWLAGGWRLFRRAPARLFALSLSILTVEGVIQATVPLAGMFLSKWVVGMLAGIVWLALANLDRSGRLRPLQALRQANGRWLALSLLAILQLAAFGTQLAVARGLLGPAGTALLLHATPTPVSSLELGVILATGIPVSSLLVFAAPRLLLDRQPLGRAVRGGTAAVLRHVAPMALVAGLTAMLIALAPATYLLSVLLAGPWLTCVGFAAYRDIGQATP